MYVIIGGLLSIFHKGIRGDNYIRVSFKEKPK
jgi:hypothetical protein